MGTRAASARSRSGRLSIVALFAVASVVMVSVAVITPEVARAASPDEQAVASGLDQLLTTLTGVDGLDELGEALPFTDMLPTGPSGLDVADAWNAVKGAIEDVPDKTADNVENALDALDGDDLGGGVILHIDVDVDPTSVSFNELSLTRATSTPLGFLSGDAQDPATFSLEGGTLNVNLALTIADDDGAGELNLELDGGQLSIPVGGGNPPSARFTASIALSGASIATRLGVVDVTATGTVSSSVVVDLAWRDPDANGRITLFELTNSAASDLFDVSFGPSNALMNLTLSSTLNGLAGVNGTISLNDTDLTNGLDTPTVSLGGLGDFTNMTPQDVLAAIAQVAVNLRSLQTVLGNPDLPFLDQNLAELGDWSDKITKLFTDNGLSLAENPIDLQIAPEEGAQCGDSLDNDGDGTVDDGCPGQPSDLEAKGLATIKGIIDELGQALTGGADDLGLEYHPTDHTVTFTIDITDANFFQESPSADFNAAEELAKAGITSLQIGGGASITISPTYSVHLTVGLDLSDALSDPAAHPITERVFLQPESGSELSFSAPVTANVDLTGQIGLLDVNLADQNAGGNVPLLAPRSAHATDPMLAVDLSGGGTDGRITIKEIFDSLSTVGVTTAGDTLTVTASGFSIAGTLNLSVPSTTLNASASVGSTPLAGGTVTFSWPDLTSGTPDITTDGSFNDNLLSFNVDPSDPLALFSTILTGIDASLGVFEDLTGTEVDQSLPIIDTSLSDLLDFVDSVQDAVNALASDPSATLQLLELSVEATIADALDQLDGVDDFQIPSLPDPADPAFSPGGEFDLALYQAAAAAFIQDLADFITQHGGNFVKMDYLPGNSPGALMFKLDIGVCSSKADYPGCTFEYPLEKDFNLDLAELGADLGGIVAASGEGQLDLDYSVVANVHLGVELPTVTPDDGDADPLPQVSGAPKIFLADTSGISASIDGEVVAQFGASIGPFEVQVGSSTPVPEADADCANSTDDDGDGAVNDGCPQVGDAAESACGADTADDDTDGTVNDGCVAVDNPLVARAGAAFSLTNDLPDPGHAYLNPGPGEPDLTAFFTGLTPAITKVDAVDCTGDATPGDADFACAHLPVYFGTGSDLTFLGNLDLTVPNFDFSGTTLTGADTIFDNLKAVAEAFVWDLIAQGIEAFGDAVDEAVSAAAYDVEIPVIGDLLDAGADVSNAFNTKVTDPLAGLIGSLNSAGDFTTIESSISNFFWTNLGGANSDPAQRFILNFDDPTAMPVQSEDVIVKTLCGADRHDCVDGVDDFLTLEDVQVQVAIGQAAAATTPAFDFGVPGLRLAGESTLSATVSWQVNLGFGVSLDDGFYLMSSTEMSAAIGGDDIAVIADVDFGTAPATLQDPAALTGDLAFLSAALWNAKDDRIDSGEAGDTDNRDAHEVHLQLGVDIPDPGASDNRIGLAELPNALDVTEWDVTLEGGVDLYATLATTAAVEGGAEEGTIPRLLADLSLVWSFTGNLQDGLALGDLEAGFDNIQLDLGSFISEFLDPVLSEVQKYTKPLQPIIDTLQAPIPGVSQLAELVGADPITLLDLMEAISGSDLTLIRRLLDVITFANSIPTVSPGNASLIIPLGEFLLDPVALTKPELPSNTKDKLIQAGSELLDTGVSGANGVLGALSSKSGDLGSGGAAFNSQMTKATSSDGGFSFPAFKDPSQLFQLLVGKDVSLVEFDAGKLRAEVGWSQSFGPITIGPVPVSIVVSISAAVEGRFVIGYDTKGIRLLVKNLTDDSPDNDGFFESVGILFAGVYLSDLDAQGNDVPEIRLTLEGAVGAAVDLVVVKVGIEAGLRATLDMNLHDGGFLDPIPPENLDGKLRIDEIITFINNPLCLFDVSGKLEAFIRVFVTIDFFLFSATFKQTIVNIVLLELDNITAELCQPPPPVLAQPTSDGSTVLRLNSGDFAGARNYAVDEPDEKFVVRQITEGSPATVTVTAFGLTQEFPGVTKVVGEGAGGKDTFITEEGGISGVCQADGTIAPPVPGMTCNGATQAGDTITKAVPFVLPVSFCGGDDDDKLGGGTGDDRLVGDGNLADGATDCTLGAAGDGSDDTDKIAGQGGVDTIRGNDGDDSLNGDSGTRLHPGRRRCRRDHRRHRPGRPLGQRGRRQHARRPRGRPLPGR